METPLQTTFRNRRTAIVALMLGLIGAANLAYALAAGPHRPADALQGVGLLLLGTGAALAGSEEIKSRLAASGRASLPTVVLSLSIVACALSVLVRAL